LWGRGDTGRAVIIVPQAGSTVAFPPAGPGSLPDSDEVAAWRWPTAPGSVESARVPHGDGTQHARLAGFSAFLLEPSSVHPPSPAGRHSARLQMLMRRHAETTGERGMSGRSCVGGVVGAGGSAC